jgi:hypothetical protein
MSYIKAGTFKGNDKLGNRIQCAAFSPSGTELMMVNDKGHLYQICNLNSNPMSVKRIATSKELTGNSESFSMAFMALPDEEAIVLAWADPSKSTGFIKKIPIMSQVGISLFWSFFIYQVLMRLNFSRVRRAIQQSMGL